MRAKHACNTDTQRLCAVHTCSACAPCVYAPGFLIGHQTRCAHTGCVQPYYFQTRACSEGFALTLYRTQLWHALSGTRSPLTTGLRQGLRMFV
eukprot:57765-Chlamydomonas_euryale.AAC.1